MRIVLAAFVVGAVLFAGCAASDGAREGGASAGWLCREPWSSCDPDAFWLRRVLSTLGHDHIGTTGSALVFSDRGAARATRYLWATAGVGAGCGWRDGFTRIDRTDVCGDAVRIYWEAQGARVWLEPPLEPRLLRSLVRATRHVRRGRVELVPLAPATIAHCRRSTLLRPACPTRAPRVGAPYLHHLARDVARPHTLDVFNLERGGEDPDDPRRNRPPRMGHLVVASGEVGLLAPIWSRGTKRIGLTDGLMLRPRQHALLFGPRAWAGRHGRLYLGPPHGSSGGMLGNHLIFRWREGDTDHVISLHGWEPLTEAAAVLRRVVASSG